MKHDGLIGTAFLMMMFGCAERPKATAGPSSLPAKASNTAAPSKHTPTTNQVAAPKTAEESETPMAAPAGNADKIVKSDEEWRKELTPEQYRVMREKGTERAFTGKYWNTTTPGVYKCAACGEVLFESQQKFDAGCGWPSFSEAVAKGTIDEHVDTSHGMVRTEVTCAKCGAHLGHLFDDGPAPSGLRYCINSVSIELDPQEKK